MSAGGVEAALNRLAKWRTILAGWQLGTRAKGDPEGDAVRDHRELSLILRAEVSALSHALIDAGVITAERFGELVEREAELLSMSLEAKFPGARATDEGIVLDARAAEWMSGWRP